MKIGSNDEFQEIENLAVQQPSSFHGIQEWLVRQGVNGILPLRRLWPALDVDPRPRNGRLAIEVVSHCWNYSHLLEYQLGALAAHPPKEVDLTMTVYFSREDERTARLLKLASKERIEGVRWSWRELRPEHLFRRSIGRNHAALSTKADWIWFTDCDLLFEEGCLDALGGVLQGRTDPLVYPRIERLTSLLSDEAVASAEEPRLRPLGTDFEFADVPVTRAKGPLQITHGDVARTMGYCRDLAVYQRAEDSFAKCREDRAFRWLLGTQGTPLDLPGVARIRHLSKGRYSERGTEVAVRSSMRRLQERLRDLRGTSPSS
ncbi:MAG: glycosyltransferase family A protein [bacterium]